MRPARPARLKTLRGTAFSGGRRLRAPQALPYTAGRRCSGGEDERFLRGRGRHGWEAAAKVGWGLARALRFFCKGRDRPQPTFAATLLPVPCGARPAASFAAAGTNGLRYPPARGEPGTLACAVLCKPCDRRIRAQSVGSVSSSASRPSVASKASSVASGSSAFFCLLSSGRCLLDGCVNSCTCLSFTIDTWV